MREEIKKRISTSLTKHGDAGGGNKRSRLYTTWSTMKGRCLCNTNTRYKWYGARGIKVCEEWENYENFKKDMFDSYNKHVKEFGEKQTTLDRINNDGNYCKENCRWATWTEQMKNQSTATLFNGESRSEASRRLGGSISLITYRVKNGMPIELAYSLPPIHKKGSRKNGWVHPVTGENIKNLSHIK